MTSAQTTVVVTGANGFVGAHVCRALLDRDATVRGVVRRPGTAPDGVEEVVGDFTDPAVAAAFCAGADAVVTTVHPMADDRATQHRIGVEGTTTVARAAADAGVPLLVHVSTAAVYDRSAGVGDVTEDGVLVGDDDNDYAVTKRDTDAALAAVDGTTRVLVRPPAILGPGETSVWNTLRPEGMRDDPAERRSPRDLTFAWVHITDLAAFLADLATGAITPPDGCTPVNLAADSDADHATRVDYFGTVLGALGLEPEWVEAPVWTGRIVAARARSWGWAPTVSLRQALDEIAAGLR